MKKILAVFILLAAFLTAKGQDSVCGIKYGTPFEEAKPKLDSMFGEIDPNESNELKLFYTEKTYEKNFYHILCFQFKKEDGKRVLCGGDLMRVFNTKEEAVLFRDYLVYRMGLEYNNITKDEEFGEFDFYRGGFDPSGMNDYGFVIAISKFRDDIFTTGIRFGSLDDFSKEQ